EQRLAEAVEAAERCPQVVRHRIRKRLELMVGRFELTCVAPQRVLRLLAGGNVANDSREGDVGSLFPGRERQLERKLRPVLSPAGELDGPADDAWLTRGQVACQSRVMRILESLGHERGERPAADLLGREPED